MELNRTTDEKKPLVIDTNIGVVTPEVLSSFLEGSDVWSKLELLVGKKRARLWRLIILLYLLNCAKAMLNSMDRLFRYIIAKGIDISARERVDLLSDGFRITVDIHVTDIDIAKLRSKWRKVFRKAKLLDHRVLEVLDPAVRNAVMLSFKLLDKLTTFEDIEEYKVVKEEPVTEGENA